jgi:acetyltransferase-like isoleucine patch superfamily enzyme
VNVATWVLRRARPHQAPVTDWPSLARALQKGARPLLYGSLRRWRFGASVFPTFIGRSVRVIAPQRLRLGRSVSIGDQSFIDCFSIGGVSFGDFVTIRERAWIQCTSSPHRPGESFRVGPHTYIGPNAVIGVGGAVSIGAKCQIGPGFTVVAEGHVSSEEAIFGGGVTRSGVTIGDDCWVGANVTVLDGVTVGNGAVIGAGTLLTRDVPANTVCFGVPGRVRRPRA